MLLNVSTRLLANDQTPPIGKACRLPFAFASWARGTSAQLPDAKYSYLFKRGAKSAHGRNGINGGHPRSGELAVYAGFGLEQTQRSARRVELTMPPFAIKLSEEPIFQSPLVAREISRLRSVRRQSPTADPMDLLTASPGGNHQ